MRLGHLASGGIELPAGVAGIEVIGISADSREVAGGFLFAALPGTRADGAGFAAEAVANGAVAIVAATGAEIDAPPRVPVLRVPDPRAALARLAATFYPAQPRHLVAVTGTSGKTSVAEFTRQIFAASGRRAASIGTLGIVTDAGSETGALTSPDPVRLHEMLNRLAADGIVAAAVEASSHGLDQRRLDGLRLSAAAFTNLGRDHLDYHRDEDDYFAAKLRLFTDLLPDDGTAVVWMGDPRSPAVAAAARARGLRVMTVGADEADLGLIHVSTSGFAQDATVRVGGRERVVTIPLTGAFQAANALVAAGLAIATGIADEIAVSALAQLRGAPGRMEYVGTSAGGGLVFVDYAHKPDAVRNVLAALRPMTLRRLVIVIGAGGDRDHGKRELMGREAAAGADVVIVTDDNPRSEDPVTIRRAILSGAPDALEIGDRAEAIHAGVAMLMAGDVLCIAGKGHETGQIIGDDVAPFSDHDVARAALADAVAS